MALNEGFRAVAYQDTRGIWTIGFGETKGVKQGQKTTIDRSLDHLATQVEDVYGAALRESLGDIPLTQNEYDALLDFIYNIGIKGFNDSTVLKLFKEGKYEEGCEAIMLWKKNKELISRRKREVNLCLGK